jgi:hypothetical protein
MLRSGRGGIWSRRRVAPAWRKLALYEDTLYEDETWWGGFGGGFPISYVEGMVIELVVAHFLGQGYSMGMLRFAGLLRER